MVNNKQGTYVLDQRKMQKRSLARAAVQLELHQPPAPSSPKKARAFHPEKTLEMAEFISQSRRNGAFDLTNEF